MDHTDVMHGRLGLGRCNRKIPGAIVDDLDFLTRRHPLALLLQKTRLPKQTCRCTLSSYRNNGSRGQMTLIHSFFFV